MGRYQVCRHVVQSMEQAVQTKHRPKRHFFSCTQSANNLPRDPLWWMSSRRPSQCDTSSLNLYYHKETYFEKYVSTQQALDNMIQKARKGGPENLRCDLSLDSSCRAPTCGLVGLHHFILHGICYSRNNTLQLATSLYTLKPRNMTSQASK